ncbi:MAG: YraN family protein [Phycisphaerae bacterium]
MSDTRSELGLQGERLAEAFLRKRGLKTLARRFATPVGEIDLVMREAETVVFVEVKTLRDRTFKDPQDQVKLPKQRKLLKAAQWFLNRKRWTDKPCRFDVVAVVLPEQDEPEIEHFPDAFVPERW